MSSQRRGAPSLFVLLFTLVSLLFVSGNAKPAYADTGSIAGTWTELTPEIINVVGSCIGYKDQFGQAFAQFCIKTIPNGPGNMTGTMTWTARATPTQKMHLQGNQVVAPLFSFVPAANTTVNWTQAVSAKPTIVRIQVDGSNATFAAFSPDAVQPETPAPNVTAGNCILSDVQIAALARSAGFVESELRTIVAIVLAESGGKVNAVNRNPSPVSYDIGLAQVNDLAHPSYDRVLLGTNPIYNMTAARTIYTSAPANSSFTPWATFNSGKHTQFLSRANAGVTNSTGVSIALSDCQGGVADPNDPTGIGTRTPTTEGDDNSCGFTFNPFRAIKCAFVPTDAGFRQWEALQTSSSTKPPLSFITGMKSFTTDVFGGYTECNYGPACPINSGQVVRSQNVILPGNTTIGKYADDNKNFDPLSKAATLAYESTWWQGIHSIFKAGLWVGFVFYGINRITNSFGAKNESGKTAVL